MVSNYHVGAINGVANVYSAYSVLNNDVSPLISSDVFSLKEHAENTVPVVHNVINSTSKVPFKETALGSYTAELKFVSIFSQYIQFSEVYLVRVLHTLILFPFHSFW